MTALSRGRTLKGKLGLEEAWQMAIQREQDARDLYEQMAEMVEDSSLKRFVSFLVEQEKNHKRLLEEEFEKYFTPEY